MAERERRERAPDPAREHPINNAIYGLMRKGFAVYYSRCIGVVPTPEEKDYEKKALLKQFDAVRAQIEAL
jgi:hypothetical protein